MSSINQVVSVTVTRATRPLSQAAFDTPLYLGAVNFFGANEFTRTYASTSAMAADGIPTNHPAYTFATVVFSQPQRPNTIIVGRQDYTAYTVTPTIADEEDFSVTIGVEGTVQTFTYTSDNSATAAEIVDGLIALVNANATIANAISATNSSDVLVITPNSGEEVFVTASSNQVVAQTGLGTVTDAITAAENASPEFFFLAAQSKAQADINSLASWAQANDKMFLTTADITTVGDNSLTNDVASVLMASQFDNTTSLAVSPENLNDQGEGGMIGVMASSLPGTSTLFAKTLVGVELENFSATQRNTVTAKNSNYYDLLGGAGFLFDGRQASGEWMDVIRFSLWAKARTAEAIFGLLKRKSDLSQKVPQSDEGDDMIRQAIFNDMINIGIRRGAILTANEGAVDPVVTIPDRSQRSQNDLAARILRDVEVEFTYSGAVQNVIVQLFVQI